MTPAASAVAGYWWLPDRSPAAWFARWRHDALQPKVYRDRAVHFIVVDAVEGEEAQFGALEEAGSDHFGRIGFGKRIEGFVAFVKRSLQGRSERGFRGDARTVGLFAGAGDDRADLHLEVGCVS